MKDEGRLMRFESGKSFVLTALMCYMLVMALFLAFVRPVKAAGLSKKAKPKFDLESCYYSGKDATLTWKKTKGAKQYIVYRASKKNGKYKKFASTKKLTITKSSKGEYYYKVKAVSGKISSKLSAPVHLFAAAGNIMYSRRFGTTIYVGGMPYRTNYKSYYYCQAQNFSKKKMVFQKEAACTFYQFDPQTREMKELETGKFGDAATIAAGKTGTFDTSAGYPTVVDGTVLVCQIPFTAGGQTFKLNIARDAVNTWISAISK